MDNRLTTESTKITKTSKHTGIFVLSAPFAVNFRNGDSGVDSAIPESLLCSASWRCGRLVSEVSCRESVGERTRPRVLFPAP